MSWQTPKTDWKSTDKFNPDDYNRIVGNILYVKDLAQKLFNEFDLQEMEEEKTYVSMIYAREMNAIEQNIETANLNTYLFDIGDTKEYSANGNTPNYEEFNRIESSILLLGNTLIAQEKALVRLSFTLGSQKGIRI